jgi:hypothetical protein
VNTLFDSAAERGLLIKLGSITMDDIVAALSAGHM